MFLLDFCQTPHHFFLTSSLPVSLGFCQHLAFHPSGACVGVATSDSKVKIYDIRMMKLQQLYSAHEGPVTEVRDLQDGEMGMMGTDREYGGKRELVFQFFSALTLDIK